MFQVADNGDDDDIQFKSRKKMRTDSVDSQEPDDGHHDDVSDGKLLCLISNDNLIVLNTLTHTLYISFRLL